MDKQTKIGFMFMFLLAIALFVSAEVSAIELNPFGNSKTFVPEIKADMSDFLKEDFNSKYGAIQLSKTRFWIETDRIAEYSLTENTDQCLINCKSKGKAVLYTDGKLFDDKSFLNKKGIEVEIDSQYYIKEIETYYEDVPQYKEVCSLQEIISNSTIKDKNLLEKPINQEVCNQELIGYEKVEKTKEVWKEYNFEVLKAGEYEWEIRGSKATSQSVDFIPTAHGKSLNEWSWWNNDWNFKRLINLTANVGNFSYLYEVPYSENMQEDYEDLRFINSAEDTELNFTIQSYNSTSAIVRIFSMGESEIYMYYGNPLATSTSSASNTHFNPIAYYYLDEASGTTAYDALGNYNGTNNGATVNQAGKIGKAYSFDGSNDVITLGSASNFIDSYNEPFTYCAWTYRTASVTAYPDRAAVGVDSISANHYQSSLGVTATNLLQIAICKRMVACNVAKSGTIDANTWVHVCGTFDGTANANGIKLYINGNYISGAQYTQGATTNSDDNMYIGSGAIGASSAFFPGNIDEVGIWDKALTSEQVYQLYTYTAPTYTIGAEEKLEEVSITLNSPADNLQSTSSTINFNATITPTNAEIKNVTLYLNDEEYLDLYDTNETINYSKILTLEDGDYTWNITACYIGESTEENCTESDTRTFIIDATLPNITILSGNGTQPYYYSGINHTVNFTIEEDKLDSGWWEYGEENIQIGYKAGGGDDCIGIPMFTYYSYNLSNFTSKKPTEMIVYGTNEIYVYNSTGKNQINYSSIIGEGYLFNLGSGYNDIGIEWVTGNSCYGYNISVDLYNLSGTLLIKDYINASEITTFDSSSFIKIDEIKVGTKLNYTSGEIKSSSASYQRELLQSIVYMNGTVVNQTKNTASTTYVLDVFMNPNPNEMVDRVEYWAREVQTNQVGYVRNRKVSPLKEEVRQFPPVTFPVTKDVYDFSIYANDTFGNVASKEINWSYYVYENSVSYNPTTTEGKIEDFVFSLTTTSEITAAIFNYDGVRSSANIYSAGTNKTISINDYEIPSIETDKNITFFLELTLTGGIKINSTSYIQSVKNLGFDDCSSNTFPLMNMSLYDEKAKTPLTGTIEVNYWIENALFTNKIATYNNTFSSTSSKRICSNVNLSGQGLYQSAIIRYSATGYVPEFYNVQRAEVDGVQYIKLYDLNESDSTEFLVTYYNDNFIKVSGAILQLLRGYIDEDIYEVVEAPLTSSEGTAIVHVDTKTNLYKAILVKDGVILNTFNDLVFACESPLVTQCEMKLSGKVEPSTSIDTADLQDISYEISTINNTVNFLFSIPSGVTSSVNLIMEQTDSFGTTQLCNKTVSSAGGTIECDFDDTIGESYLTLYVEKDETPIVHKQYAIMEDSPLKFLGNNFFIVFIMLLSVVGMAFSSPEWIIINASVTLLISGSLWLLNGMDFVIGIGAIMWLLVGAIILISKLAKQEDR